MEKLSRLLSFSPRSSSTKRPRDSQRGAVYAWERLLVDLEAGNGNESIREELSLEASIALVERVWRDYRPGDKPPRVKDGRGTRSAYGGRWTISLPVWARTRKTILHETAHSLLSSSVAPHGPEFARLQLELLVRYAGVSRSRARHAGVHQRPRRVRFASPSAVPAPASRATRKAWKRILELRATIASAKAEIARIRESLGT